MSNHTIGGPTGGINFDPESIIYHFDNWHGHVDLESIAEQVQGLPQDFAQEFIRGIPKMVKEFRADDPMVDLNYPANLIMAIWGQKDTGELCIHMRLRIEVDDLYYPDSKDRSFTLISRGRDDLDEYQWEEEANKLHDNLVSFLNTGLKHLFEGGFEGHWEIPGPTSADEWADQMAKRPGVRCTKYKPEQKGKTDKANEGLEALLKTVPPAGQPTRTREEMNRPTLTPELRKELLEANSTEKPVIIGTRGPCRAFPQTQVNPCILCKKDVFGSATTRERAEVHGKPVYIHLGCMVKYGLDELPNFQMQPIAQTEIDAAAQALEKEGEDPAKVANFVKRLNTHFPQIFRHLHTLSNEELDKI